MDAKEEQIRNAVQKYQEKDAAQKVGMRPQFREDLMDVRGVYLEDTIYLLSVIDKLRQGKD